jgi:hypothetical protein
MGALAKVLFAVFLALQPLSTWTLLGVFGSDHSVRLAMVDGGFNLILVHSEDSSADLQHHHTAADRILAASANHAAGVGDHMVRSAQGDVTPAKRAAIAPLVMTVSLCLPVPVRAGSLASHLLDASPSPSPPPRAAPLLL